MNNFSCQISGPDLKARRPSFDGINDDQSSIFVYLEAGHRDEIRNQTHGEPDRKCGV